MSRSERSNRWQLAVLLVFLILSSLPALAQDTGRIVGVVTDPSGSVVPKASVTVTNTETQISNSTTSGADGNYQILALPIGSYTVSASSPGFRKVSVSAQ